MGKEIKRVSIEIEHYNGSTYLGFMLSIMDDGEIKVVKTKNCSHADTDEDYIFDSENDLIRIQSDNIISENEYESIKEKYYEIEG